MVVDRKAVNTRRIVLLFLLFFVYGFIFFASSLFFFIKDQSYRQITHVLISDGNILYAGNRNSDSCYEFRYYNKPLYIDDEYAVAGIEGNKLSIWVGSKEIVRNGFGLSNWLWAPERKCLLFLQSADQNSATKKHIWKWSPAEGFTCLTKRPQDFYHLRLSTDGRYVSSLIYDDSPETENSVFTCLIADGSFQRHNYGKSNFGSTYLGANEYLMEVDDPFRESSIGASPLQVYRWSTDSEHSEPFAIGGKAVRSAEAIGGSVWVLFQEPDYQWYPWMVRRGKDKVTIAKLSKDLKTIVETYPLVMDR